MIYTPRELPLLRYRCAEYYGTDKGREMFKSLAQTQQTDEQAGRNAKDAVRAFQDAELFHIAPSMVDLLAQARDGVGQAGLMEYDLPAQTGLAYLAAESLVQPSTDEPEEYAGFDALSEEDQEEMANVRSLMQQQWTQHLLMTWLFVPADGPDDADLPHGAVLLNFYQQRDAWGTWASALFSANERANAEIRQGRGEDAELAKQLDRWMEDPDRLRRRMPEFVYDGSVVIAFSPDAADLRVATTDPHGGWRRKRADTFRAMCYLLRQRIAQDEVVRPDRATQRRMAREGREPEPVRLISLRGASASGGGDGSREFVHRWIVRGHWRRQWYRSIQSHRPIWISPFVKGPEDAPMLGGEKVYTASAPA